MSINKESKNLANISVTAKAALLGSNYYLRQFITVGPTIRARVRLSLLVALFIAAPALLIGVIRTEKVSHHAARLSQYDDYAKQLLGIRILVKELDIAIWEYSVESELENSQIVLMASENLIESIEKFISQCPLGLDLGAKGYIDGLVYRLDKVIKQSLSNRSTMPQARLNIISLSNELMEIEKRVYNLARQEKKQALGALAMVGRDQLILFLLLLFAMPIFIFFAPGWILRPLARLRQMSSKIELGHLKDIPIRGKDEVAILGRSLKSYFLRKEELDQKKSSKIFEMRNVLRSVINRVSEPVFIVDSSTKINYTNDAGASFIGIPAHQIEGKLITDCMHSSSMKKILEKAFIGSLVDQSIEIPIETMDGRICSMKTKIGMVRNRDGEVSRAVIVMS